MTAPPGSAGGAPARPRVVILGGGFGGLYAARALRREAVDVTVIDRTNHHVFQPLLYQVATATLAPSDISAPIRWLLRNQRNTTVLLAEALSIDPGRRVVRIGGDVEREMPYEYLIVATGSRHSYFGHAEWEQHAPGLKSLDDALEIRRRFLLAFERAELSEDEAERRALLTFVVVGGGPTGVELAGMLPLVAHRAMGREFRHIDTRSARFLLLEGGPRLLPNFPARLSAVAERDLTRLGVEVRTGAIVSRVESGAVWVGDERIETRTIFWGAGNEASPLAKSLAAPLDRAGRVLVRSDLSVPGHPDIFVVGDLAHVEQDGRQVPAVAQGGIQEGTAVARNIRRDLAGEPRRPFRYFNKGDMATIGRHRAIADFGRVQTSGRLTWWLWLLLHILYLAGFRNRLSVALQWAWAYFTYQRGVRLILGTARSAKSDGRRQASAVEARATANPPAARSWPV